MARREVQVKFCDACIKDTPATTTQKFSLNSVDYEIDVCEKHADAITRDFLGWARLARERERPNNFRSPDAVRAYTRGEFSPIGMKSPAATVPTEAQPEPVPALAAIPHTAQNWTLTEHAEEQLTERGQHFGFDRRDVFLCATQPEHVIPAKGGRKQHVRGNVSLIVQPEQKVVVTVLPRSTRDFATKELVFNAGR